MNTIKIKDGLIFVGVIAIILLLVFRGNESPVFKVSPIKKIETRIEGKETRINTIETRIGNEKEIISKISNQIGMLRADLETFKAERDTVRIIQIQDTIINVLTSENTFLKSVVTGQDSIIVHQRYIINSKDTIIAVLKSDTKRFKKQRNISVLINALLTGAVILK
tara:strand:+ start:1587 stop:2084 length:498 start_codon:yes stop_codon:yes gene_type:complete